MQWRIYVWQRILLGRPGSADADEDWGFRSQEWDYLKEELTWLRTVRLLRKAERLYVPVMPLRPGEVNEYWQPMIGRENTYVLTSQRLPDAARRNSGGAGEASQGLEGPARLDNGTDRTSGSNHGFGCDSQGMLTLCFAKFLGR